jgi:acetyltransferase
MSEDLDCLFQPKRVAVVGASTKPTNLGHMVVRNLLEGNFPGVVYPINPKHESIGGVPAFPSVAETPAVPDLAIICIPAKGVLDVVEQCAKLGTKGLIILTAGFRETGPEGRAVEDKIVETARANGMRILGPNCLGLQVPGLSLNASFAAHMPGAGHVAFISQSGALTAGAIEWAIGKGIGFSKIVSLGNAADVDLAAVLDYLADDEDTHSAVVYAESISDPQAFTSAAARFSAKKPIIAYKAGRFAASAKAAVSHTGAMAGADSVYDAAFERVGVTRVLRISDLYHAIELLDAGRVARQPSLAIVTNAGGPGVMSADALIARKGKLADLSQGTLDALNEVLPAAWSHSNPIDVLGDAPAARYQAAIKAAVADSNVDAVLVILTPQSMTDILGSADAVIEAAKTTDKPILGVWMGGGDTNEEAIARLDAAGVPAYEFPENAVDAFMDIVASHRGPLPSVSVTPADGFEPDRGRARELIASVPEEGVLSELAGKELFDAYGISVALSRLAATADEAVALADEFGYPVVIKIASPDITHKTDVGGVVIDVNSAEEVREVFARVVASAREKRPDAAIDGVTVQPMIPAGGQELILGSRQDPSFGAIIMVAAGGTSAEILGDSAIQLAPVDSDMALSMLKSLRIWPILEGYRGRPGADLDQLTTIIERFSRLVCEHPEITEIEINPVLASSPRGAIAIDARAVVDRDALANPPAPYSHLGIAVGQAPQA